MTYRSLCRGRPLRELLLVGAGLISLMLLWYLAELRYARQVTPNGWSTVADFIDRHGVPRAVYEV
jgi:hypothetical protein